MVKPWAWILPFLCWDRAWSRISYYFCQRPPQFLRGIDCLWPSKESIKNIVLVIAALFFYVAFLENIGFSICTFLVMVFYVRVIGSQKWISAVLFAVITTLISYMLFEIVLKAQLPPGFLGNYNIWIF